VTHDNDLQTVITDLRTEGYFSVAAITAKELIERFGQFL
jgi:hypothetical protein